MVKIERSFPAPESLEIESKKVSGSYSEPDVIERLQQDFHDKCYICELDKLQDPQVEHLLPHLNGKYPERKFNWNNLFWACGHCNGIKNQKIYDEGIIDCCEDDPEIYICFRLNNEEIQVYAKEESNRKAVLTAKLVSEVFNKKNTGMRTYTSEMRLQELNREMNKLYDSLEEIKKHPDSKVTLRILKSLLRRESRFAAFKRNYIRENEKQYPELLVYIV